MKALVIISRDQDKASTRFRFVQYEPLLAERGVSLEYVRRDAIDDAVLNSLSNYDVVVNQKCLMRRSLAQKIIQNSKRIVFDMDDAIWTRSGRQHSWITAQRIKLRLKQWLRAADAVTVANDYLASYARQYSDKVEIIHMALDTEKWRPREGHGDRDSLTIGWAGSPATLSNLEGIGKQLCETLQEDSLLHLAVFCGKRPMLDCDFAYTPYVSGTEVDFVRELDIGLLPLPHDDEFNRGKSPIKALQYMACGIPVVAQVRGATAEILDETNSIAIESDKDWCKAIDELVIDTKKRKAMGEAGREFILREHNMQKTVEQIIAALSGNRNP